MSDVKPPSPETVSWIWTIGEHIGPAMWAGAAFIASSLWNEWKINRDRDAKRAESVARIDRERTELSAMVDSIKDVQLHQRDEIDDLKLLAPKVAEVQISTGHLAKRLDALQDDVKSIRQDMGNVAKKEDIARIEDNIAELRADMRHMLFTLARTPMPTGSN